jgi:hypothetical protein
MALWFEIDFKTAEQLVELHGQRNRVACSIDITAFDQMYNAVIEHIEYCEGYFFRFILDEKSAEEQINLALTANPEIQAQYRDRRHRTY